MIIIDIAKKSLKQDKFAVALRFIRAFRLGVLLDQNYTFQHGRQGQIWRQLLRGERLVDILKYVTKGTRSMESGNQGYKVK
jgi:hypothetical protein